MEGRWDRPQEKGQVVYHHRPQRFGLVTESMDCVDPRGQKVQIFFPDKMRVGSRYSTAFVESGYVVPPASTVNGLREGYQGLCWLDSKEEMWYLMADGLSCTEPEMLRVIAPNDNTVRRYRGSQQRRDGFP